MVHSPGRRAPTLAAESRKITLAQPLASLTILFVSAAVCFVTLATLGRAAGQRREVLSAFSEAGAHVFSIENPTGSASISADDVTRIAEIDHVEWAVGLGATFDVRPSGLAAASPVPARAVSGAPRALGLSSAIPGAFVTPDTQRQLGLVSPAGAVTGPLGGVFPIAGTFSATGGLTQLGGYVLISPAPAGTSIRRVLVAVDDPRVLATVAAAATLLLHAPPGELSVSEPTQLTDARQVVASTVDRFGRTTILQIFAAGLVFAALTVYLHTASRRRDYGRRRALGARRLDIVGLVVGSVLWSAVPGALLGGLIGTVVVRFGAGVSMGWAFPVAVGVLTVLTIGFAAVPSAMLTAWRDPVRVLRVP